MTRRAELKNCIYWTPRVRSLVRVVLSSTRAPKRHVWHGRKHIILRVDNRWRWNGTPPIRPMTAVGAPLWSRLHNTDMYFLSCYHLKVTDQSLNAEQHTVAWRFGADHNKSFRNAFATSSVEMRRLNHLHTCESTFWSRFWSCGHICHVNMLDASTPTTTSALAVVVPRVTFKEKYRSVHK